MIPSAVHTIAFSRLHGMNISLARNILARLDGDVGRFFDLPAPQLSHLMGFDSRLFSDDMRRRVLDEAMREERFINANGIRARFHADTAAAYPRRLAQCDDAPATLFTIGNCDLDSACMVAIVGTRHATVYGTDFTSRLVSELAVSVAEPVVIVSGLAYGIDVAAHRAALTAGLPTVGVLAHGLNTIYPAAHRSVAAEIIGAGGALVTEYTSADTVHRGNFLARNRIVAGLCDCVVVVESDTKGGALVTARLASDYNREVFALPGRLSDHYSRGCNKLIARNMAHAITDIATVAREMRWPRRSAEGIQQQLFSEVDEGEQRVLDLLSANGEMRLGEMATRLNEKTHTLMARLIDMELRGLVLTIPGNRYRLA